VVAAAWWGFAGWGWAGLVVTLVVGAALVGVVGELVPIRVAARHGVRIALGSAPALRLLCRVFGPVLGVVERVVGPLVERAPEGPPTEQEIRQLTVLGRTEGVIDEHERQIIERAFRLDETRAWQIMTPRVDIFAWPDARTLAEIAPELRSVPYSRVPVYGESVDDITGVLYLRDAYQALLAGQRDVPLRALAREPLVVPGSVPLTKLLRDFQTRRIHMAIVVDEYGGTDGLVTLEDVLEELVGEIVDEKEVAQEPIVRVSRHEIVARGDADLREINHVLNTAFPQLEHRSLNGYLLEELGRVPEPGTKLERDGVLIEVLEATETQVLRARLVRRVPAGEAGGWREGGEGAGAGGEGGGEPGLKAAAAPVQPGASSLAT